MGSFSGKVAFLTGSGSGMARASAILLAAKGAQVVIAELKPELGASTEKAIRDAGGDALFVETDVTSEDSVKAAIETTVKRYGRLHILHNCAGGAFPADGAVTQVDMALWEPTMNLNLKGTFLCCRHAIPAIINSGGGSVINTTSWRGLIGAGSNHVAANHLYVSTKGAIISLTKALAAEYVQQRVRVNAIAPGSIRTERTAAKRSDRAKNPSAHDLERRKFAELYPYAEGDPEDAAQIIVFLASDKSRLITGAIIPADGGRSAYV